MSEHTEGPWVVGSHQCIKSVGWSIRIGDGSAIAYVLGERNPELAANARLIAAAPDLLEALEATLGWCHDIPTDVEAEARAAIAKAKGGGHGKL